jgi:hypothetical protein
VCDKSKYIEPAVNVGKNITAQYLFQNRPIAIKLGGRKKAYKSLQNTFNTTTK